MRAPSHGTSPRHANVADRKRLVTRWWFWSGIVVLLIIACGSWVGVRGLQAKSELEQAQGLVSQLKAQALGQNIPSATKTLKALRTHADKAQELTSDPIWRAAEVIPSLGRNLTAVRELAAVTKAIVADGVSPLMQVASAITPASLAPKDGAVNLEPLTKAVAPVKAANKAFQSAAVAIKAIDTSGTLSQLPAAKKKLSGLLDSVAPLLRTLQQVLPMLPPIMGAEGPRNYVVMFQNNAEARALGGTSLSFALLTMDGGKIHLAAPVAAGFSNFDHYPSSVVPLPDGAEAIYGAGFGTFIANSTVRPSFVSAAEVTSVMWKKQFGLTVDGVISLDPVALSYILSATGPIPLTSGDVLSNKTLVPLLLNGVYQRYNTGNNLADNTAQDAVYGEAVAGTFTRLSSGKFDAKILLSAAMRGWDERRLLFWSANKDEQSEFTKIGLNGELPKSDEKTDRVGVYFQDAIGSKMDYYLTQSVQLSQAVCRADDRANYRVSIDLTNTAPADAEQSLSRFILGTSEQEGVIPGHQRMIVMLYAPPGSQIVGATAGGKVVKLEKLHDTDYPVAKVLVNFAQGVTEKLTFDFVPEKAGKRVLEAQITPMVHPTPLTNVPLDCATVAAK